MNRQILRLAIPNIISNISVPLISAVDTALMGHLSSGHLAALGIGAMIFVFLYGSFNFLRMGTTGLTAQAFGENDSKEMANTLFRAIMIGLFIAVVLMLFRAPLLEISSYLMNVDASYHDKVARYFDIRIYAAPAVLLQFALMGWFFGMQNAIIPLLMTLVINLVNIFLSYYLVNHLHLGIEGAAYGTLVAQYIGVVFGFIMIARYSDILKLASYHDSLQKEKLLRFFSVNKDIFIRTLALTFSLAFFYSQAAKHSQETLSTMVLLLQFMIWMAFALDGFANAAESLVGKYYGAKDWKNFNKAIAYNFYWAGGFALMFSLVYYFFGKTLLELYTNQTHLITLSLPYMWLVALLPLLSFVAFIFDGVFVGMTASKSMRDAVLLSTLLFVGIFYLTRGIDYAWALWGSFVLFFVFRGLLQSWMFYKKGRGLR